MKAAGGGTFYLDQKNKINLLNFHSRVCFAIIPHDIFPSFPFLFAKKELMCVSNRCFSLFWRQRCNFPVCQSYFRPRLSLLFSRTKKVIYYTFATQNLLLPKGGKRVCALTHSLCKRSSEVRTQVQVRSFPFWFIRTSLFPTSKEKECKKYWSHFSF